MNIKDKQISFTVQQLLLYGGIPVVIIIIAFVFLSNYEIGINKKGSMGSGGKIMKVAENSPKRIEYQGEKYMLDGDYCRKSTGQRIAITVNRLEGVGQAGGSDGNTMYAIDKKDSPAYIDSEGDIKTAFEMRDCWMKESLYKQ